MYKRSFGTRVWIIADKYNIEQTQVRRIIASYISYCREELFKGSEVTFLGLVTLIPDVLTTDYRTTFAYQCKCTSEQCGVGYHTVFSVVREYLDFLRRDLLDGHSVDIRGAVSLHPVFKDGVVIKVHSAISVSIKRDLAEKNSCVTSIRAHTNKLLKRSVKLNREA